MSQKQHQDIGSLPSVDSADAPPDLYVEIIDHLRLFPAKLEKKCQTAKLFNKKTENIYVSDGMVKEKDYFLERKKWSGD